jgi:hypothetical protein
MEGMAAPNKRSPTANSKLIVGRGVPTGAVAYSQPGTVPSV